MSKSSKGGAFEREMCVRLSKWWTGGARDDIFWRSATSGGRATIRARMGKSTFGQHGDIQAVDPIGQPLTKLCTIEMKRGYTSQTFADLIDKPNGPSQWRDFICQVRRERSSAGTPFWLLIVRRDRREPCIFMPRRLYSMLKAARPKAWGDFKSPRTSVLLDFESSGEGSKSSRLSVVGLHLDDFFDRVSDADILNISALMEY